MSTLHLIDGKNQMIVKGAVDKQSKSGRKREFEKLLRKIKKKYNVKIRNSRWKV